MRHAPIDDLSADVLSVVQNLAYCVLEQEDQYYIQTRIDTSSRKSTRYVYSVIFPNGIEPSIRPPFSCRYDIEALLSPRGYMVPFMSSSRRDFVFSESGLADLRERFPPSSLDVRRYIGHFLFRAWQASPSNLRSRFRIDVDQFCERRGIKRRDFTVQAHMLVNQGYAKFSGHAENSVEEGYLWLTPAGINWAGGHFSDWNEREGITTNVHVDVHIITINRFIDELNKTDLPDETRKSVEELAKELETEPTMEKVARLFDLASNTQQLLPPLIRLVSENASSLLSLFR